MLAKRVDDLPPGENWIFEPKWDGFRALIFRDRDEIYIQSRDEKPLNRYFPELVETLRLQLPDRCVLDGEIVIARDNALDFDSLQLRLHPAASRVKLLSQQIPASIVFFDLLCVDHRDLRTAAFETRRQELENLLSSAHPPIHLTPATRDPSVASDWFRRFEGAGLDGVMAKPVSGTYEPNKRTMLKVKHERECDCVVAGFRWYKNAERAAVGSLCSDFSIARARYSMWACAPALQRSAAKNWSIFLLPTGPTPSPIILGKSGPTRGLTQRKRVAACPAGRADGARARIFPGNLYVRIWSSKWHTNTCKATASATCRTSSDGATTSVRRIARMRSLK